MYAYLSLPALNRYLVDLKDVADRHILYPEEHAQEEELELQHLREKIRATKEETDLRDCYYPNFILQSHAYCSILIQKD